MKKHTKIGLSVVALVALASVLLALFQSEQRQEIVKKSTPQVIEPAMQEVQIEAPDEELNAGSESKEFVETEPNDPEKRVIVKYMEPLPPQPSEDEAKYGFPDVNNNKVRDDIEILIVEEFGDDSILVEAFFADARTREHDLYLAKNDLLTKVNIQKSIEHISYKVECQYLVYKDGDVDQNGFSGLDGKQDSVFKGYDNTKEKKRLHQMVRDASHGYVMMIGGYSFSDCIDFFSGTKDLSI